MNNPAAEVGGLIVYRKNWLAVPLEWCAGVYCCGLIMVLLDDGTLHRTSCMHVRTYPTGRREPHAL